MVDHRRSHRSPLDAAVLVRQKSGAEPVAGSARDISVGGMFIETPSPFPFGTEVVIQMRLPGHKDEMALPGVVRWTRADGMGIQFGLLGARDTHAITEVVHAALNA
jgi:Tfp pilus assembly protein PilZ